MSLGFPMPFGGIKVMLAFGNRETMVEVLTYMAEGCEMGHSHNIAVEFDGNRIWTTDLGAACIERALNQEDTHGDGHRGPAPEDAIG